MKSIKHCHIRRARPEDAEDIAKIIPEWAEVDIVGELREPDSLIGVALQFNLSAMHSELVGVFWSTYLDDGATAFLQEIRVHEKHRRKGIGSTMLLAYGIAGKVHRVDTFETTIFLEDVATGDFLRKHGWKSVEIDRETGMQKMRPRLKV